MIEGDRRRPAIRKALSPALRATLVAAVAPLVAVISAGCSGAPSPPPAAAPPKCSTATATLAPATAALPATASAQPAAPAVPKVPAFELEKAASRQSLRLEKLAVKRASSSSYSLVPRAGGGAWLVPESASRGEGLVSVGADGTPREVWSAPGSVGLWAARKGAEGVVVAGVPVAKGDFSFSHIERVFYLSPDGRTTFDHVFTAGLVQPRAASAGAYGSFLVAGTLAGTLRESGTGKIVPDAGGRAEVLLSIDYDAKVEWSTALEAASGRIGTMAAATDGSALVVSSPAIGDQVLSGFKPSGELLWKKLLRAPATARFPTPAIASVVSDGKGGYFAEGWLNSDGGLDFGLGPLGGEGHFVVRLDAKGQGAWERRFAEQHVISSDGEGSLLAVSLAPSEEKLHAYEIDSEARVVRAVDIDVPGDCRTGAHPFTIVAAGAMTANAIFVMVTCQAMDETSMPQLPIGKPLIYTGSLARK